MSIDQFHELQQQMEQFQDNLHRVLEEKKRLLLGTVEAYHEDVAELRSRQEELSKKIQGLQLNQSELQNGMFPPLYTVLWHYGDLSPPFSLLTASSPPPPPSFFSLQTSNHHKH